MVRLFTFIPTKDRDMLVEVCVQNLEAALVAQDAGADRIELCTELGLGGITPSIGLMRTVKNHLNIPIHILVRPRAGDFVYSAYEFEAMVEDVQAIKELGVSGIVIGMLDEKGGIEWDRLAHIREETRGMHLTFHRAFDFLKDPKTGLAQLESMGIDTVLTSGQKNQATEGMPLLLELNARASSITVMPGGGIRPGNIEKFRIAGFSAIHFSGTTEVNPVTGPQDNKRLTLVELGHVPKYEIQPEQVQQMIQSVK